MLLCYLCYQTAEVKDKILESQLAELCDAATILKPRIRDFGKELLQSGDAIPENRRREMKEYLSTYYKIPPEELDAEIFQRAAKISDDFVYPKLKVRNISSSPEIRGGLEALYPSPYLFDPAITGRRMDESKLRR